MEPMRSYQYFIFEEAHDEESSNFFNLPNKFSAQVIQNADKLHAALQKAGLQGCFNSVLDCIVILSKESSEVLQKVIDNDTQYSNWNPIVYARGHCTGNAVVYL